MHEFLIDFEDLKADNTIIVHDTVTRKKPLKIGDLVSVRDEVGNICYGIIERINAPLSLLTLALDRSTFTSVRYG